MGISFPKFFKGLVRELKLRVIDEGAAPHAVALYLPGNFLTLAESGSVNEACKKKACIVLAH